MFLQAGITTMSTKSIGKQTFSIWEMLFSGGIIGNIILITIFLMGILALYVFFEKYFFIKRASMENSNLLENIKDCIHEARIETAIDLCKETDSPEARMTEKGLLRIGRPISDISLAMQNQGQLEIFNFKKKLKFLLLTAVLTPMLGLLGTIISMIMVFFKSINAIGELPSNYLITGIYNALPPVTVGLAISIPTYFLYYFLTTKVEQLMLRIQLHENDFLDSLNKPL